MEADVAGRTATATVVNRGTVLWLSLGASALYAASAQAQTELRLIVADSVTAAPIPGALIELANADGKRVWSGVAGADGRAVVRVAPGEMTIVAMMIGYRPVGPSAFMAPAQDFVGVRILMVPTPVALDSIEVSARRRTMPGPRDRAGFEWRRTHRPFGTFLEAKDLGGHLLSLTSVLRRVTGVRIEQQAVGPTLVYMRGSTVIDTNGAPVTCGPKVYRDGMLVHNGGDGAPIDDLVPVTDVKAVEIYTSAAEVPIEFERGPGACGAIVVWTR
jgi:hypothetical protein